jgi:hypothetical protein
MMLQSPNQPKTNKNQPQVGLNKTNQAKTKGNPGLQTHTKNSAKKLRLHSSSEGYEITGGQTANQKKRAKIGLNPNADIICESGTTIYPQWNGKISELQAWIQTTQGGSAFHKTNTNSLLCHIKGMSIVFYVNSGCFQINRGQNNTTTVKQMVEDLKEWLEKNHDEDHDIHQETISFLDEKSNQTTTHPQMDSEGDETTRETIHVADLVRRPKKVNTSLTLTSKQHCTEPSSNPSRRRLLRQKTNPPMMID